MPDLDAAHHFLAAHGRVLDLRRFERLFLGGDAAPVRDAVAAYRNADGGFGNALEPDGRTPHSQPAATEQALRILDQADAWDDDLAAGACDQLQATAPPEGGAIFVAANVEGWPHAPWWQPQEGFSLISTGQILGSLLARGVEHPWVETATELMWARIDALDDPGAYDLHGVLRFLEHAPDRERAGTALERAEAAIRQDRHTRPRRARRDPRPARLRAAPRLARAPAVRRCHHRRPPRPPRRRSAGRRRLDVQLPGLVSRPGGGLARQLHGRRARHAPTQRAPALID